MQGGALWVKVSAVRLWRFYIFLLGLAVLPEPLAGSDLVRWLAAEGQLALGLSVPVLLLLLNLPMVAEVFLRKQKVHLPRFLAVSLQTPWTAWCLGSIFYVILRAVWTAVHLGPPPTPAPLALSPYALPLYRCLFAGPVRRLEP